MSSGERNVIYSTICNEKLKNIFDALYRVNDEFPGGTAGAVIQEFKTGNLLSNSGHAIKAQDRINGLEKILASPAISQGDSEIAQILLNQLKEALSIVKK